MKRKLRPHHYPLGLIALGILTTAGLMGGIYLYRDRIFKQFQREISARIRGTFLADNFHVLFWEDGSPGLTLLLQNVRLEDDSLKHHHQDFLKLKEVRIRLDLMRLFKKQVRMTSLRLVDGNLTAFRQANGYANWSLFERDTAYRPQPGEESGSTAKSGFLVEIEKIKLENVQVRFVDSLHHKWYGGLFRKVECRISRDQQALLGHITGPMHLDGLAFNPKKGSFGTNQETDLHLRVRLDTTARLLTLEPSRLVFARKDTLRANGTFQFHVRRPPDMNLYLHLQRMPLPTALGLMNRHLATTIGKFGLFPKVRKADIRISGSTGPGREPNIDLTFSTDPTKYNSLVGELSALTLKGHFTNHLDPKREPGDPNSRLLFEQYSAEWEETIPVSGRLVIHNLDESRAFLTTRVDADLARMNENLNATHYLLEKGHIRMDAYYRGGVNAIFDKKTGNLSGLLAGTLRVQDGSFRYLTRKLHFEKLNIEADFDARDLYVRSISAQINKSPVYVHGHIRKLIPFLTVPNTRLYAQAAITSPNLNFNASKILPRPALKSANMRKKARKELITKIDRILDHLETDISVKLDRFQYRHFAATQVRGQLGLSARKLEIKNLKMNAFKGDFDFSGQIDYLHDHPARMSVACRLQNTDIRQLFYAFDDFQQTTITHKNINGIWSSEGKIEAQLNRDYTPLPGTFYGYLNFRLKNGELIQFEPLKRLQRFIFKNRDFDNVRFAPLASQFRFRGREIEMDRMGIESSALTLYVGGTYSFAKKTDLFVQIPLKNLRKRGKDYELVELDAKEIPGWTLNLRARDEGDEVRIRLDIGQRARQRKARRQQAEGDPGALK